MRQAGIVAAAALYALDHTSTGWPRTTSARGPLADGLAAAGLPVDPGGDRDELRRARRRLARPTSAADARARIAEQGVLAGALRPGVVRLATYLGIEDDDVARAVEAIPRGARRACPRLSRCASRSTRRLRTAQAELRMPSVSAAVFRDGAIALAAGARPRRGRSRTRARHPSTSTASARSRRPSPPCSCCSSVTPGELELTTPLARARRRRRRPGRRSPTRSRTSPASSASRPETSGRRWSVPDRAGLLASLADAEQVLAPASRWHYSNLAYGAPRRGRSSASRRALREACCASESSSRSACGGRRSRPRRRIAQGYLVEPYSDGVRAEQHVESCRGGRCARPALEHGRRPRPLGLVPRRRRRARARAVDARRDGARTDDGRRGSGGSWPGASGSASTGASDRVFAGHDGAMPGFLAGLVVSRATGIGASVLTNSSAGGQPLGLALDLASLALARLPAEPAPWRPDAGAPPELEPLLGRWWTRGVASSSSRSAAGASRHGSSAVRPVATSSWFEPDGDDRWRVAEGRELGEVLRVVRDDDGTPVRLYLATYPVTREPVEVSASRADGRRRGRTPRRPRRSRRRA